MLRGFGWKHIFVHAMVVMGLLTCLAQNGPKESEPVPGSKPPTQVTGSAKKPAPAEQLRELRAQLQRQKQIIQQQQRQIQQLQQRLQKNHSQVQEQTRELQSSADQALAQSDQNDRRLRALQEELHSLQDMLGEPAGKTQ